jgi:holo-[acyl-carrier protein] synthase
MPIAVGIDLVGYDEITETLRRGDRYLRRIYTDEELDVCGARPRLLAACFAAKEATMKALSRTDQPIPWRSIELRMRGGSQPSLGLTGAAASLARERRVTGLSVSVTHGSHSAAAVVLASTGGAS